MEREMNTYTELVAQLSWHNTSAVQAAAINALSQKNDWDYSGAIINSEKGCWVNLFKVFDIMGADDSLLINDYLLLLQDLNWPGALTAYDKLKKMKKEIIAPGLASALAKAALEQDEAWEHNLRSLADFHGIVVTPALLNLIDM